MLSQHGLLVVTSAAAVALFAWLVVQGWKRRTLGWLCALGYAAALFPVSNLLPTVPMVADRYAQLPLFALVPLVVVPALARLPVRLQAAAVALVVAALSLATARQVPVWRDDAKLFAHAIAVNPQASAALGNLGLSLWDRGRREEALRVVERLHAVAPRDFRFAYTQGLEAQRLGRLAEAQRWFEEAAGGEGEPRYVAYMKLGDVYLQRERREDARRAYARALDLAERFPVSGPHRYAIQRQLAFLGGAP
jgi:Flp pilus assembly protein TadD